jgi:hypothetical protein
LAAVRKACSTIHNRFATEHDLERLGSVLGAAQRGRRTSSPARSCRDQSEALAADRLKAAAETRIAHERFVTLACLRQSSAAIEACQRSCANLSVRALNGLALTQGRPLSAVGTVLLRPLMVAADNVASPSWPRGSVATVFWSTAVSASQASSISTIHRSLPTDALSRPAAAVSPRATFPKRSHERLDGGGPVSQVRRFIRERPRCPRNYSRDVTRKHRDHRE